MYASDIIYPRKKADSYQPAGIMLPFCLLAPILVAAALMSHATEAAAAGGNCRLKNMGSFGNVALDIVSDSSASAISQLEFECNSPVKYTSIQFCTYIQAPGSPSTNSQANVFYQTRDTDSRLAWQMKLAGGGNETLASFGTASPTTGWTHNATWSAANQTTTASQQFILSYLGRQQQDRVRAGIYSSTYQLVTQYQFNNGIKSSCNPGLTNPDGTLFTSFATTATVTQNCRMENFQDIDFGDQNSLDIASKGSKQTRAYGNIGIRCTYQTPYKISISKGNYAKDDIANMKNEDNFLPYKLWQAGCNIPWDDQSLLSGTGNLVNAINNHQVCAQILTPLAHAPAAGSYTDTVIVTATF